MNPSKSKGTAAETAVARVFQTSGFPHCERRTLSGSQDKGDLQLLGVCVEIKGGAAAERASDGQIVAWLVETEVERVNARADIGLLVTKRPGIGYANADRWWCHMRVADLAALLQIDSFHLGPAADAPVRLHLNVAITLLRLAGYGTAIEDKDAA